ncbi:hypothetical protein [Sphingomonas guangdongensis]|uniref:hypothetical protein n=1 Tax=Sphingomonas guangdongensis TaxID=1141890 RepID=UPI001181B7B8|nr:hypothetical protein [Sphingomonas guangdongensis]
MKHYFDSLNDMLNATSLVSGSALGSYLAISVAGSGSVAALGYVNLTLTFLCATIVVMLINTLPKFLLLGLYRLAGYIAVALSVSIYFLLDAASRVGVQVGVVACALVAWMIVPVSAAYWGRQMRMEKVGND